MSVVTIGFEPNFAACLLAEAGTPSDPNGWRIVLDRLLTIGPDMLYFAAVGLLLWNTGGRRESAMSALTVLLLVVGVVSSLKRGADLNYYLSLRGRRGPGCWDALARRDDLDDACEGDSGPPR